MSRVEGAFKVAVACGGTGGHFFPGISVAQALGSLGGELLLIVSEKAVDQRALRGVSNLRVLQLPAVGLQGLGFPRFVSGLWKAWLRVRPHFQTWRPDAVLAMGGFTSVAPVLAARRQHARVFLHEANTIPGRANRWLAPFADQVFTGFAETVARFPTGRATFVGTPVRPGFGHLASAEARRWFGLADDRPVLLVVGGSQGARALNRLVTEALPCLVRRQPELQYVHLTGPDDLDAVTRAYHAHDRRAYVGAFLDRMDLALAAATLAISRAGASSLAEFACAGLPAILVPYPTAADDHQRHNARVFEAAGAARVMEQGSAAAETVAALIAELCLGGERCPRMQTAMLACHRPDAAEVMARAIVEHCRGHGSARVAGPAAPGALFSNRSGSAPTGKAWGLTR